MVTTHVVINAANIAIQGIVNAKPNAIAIKVPVIIPSKIPNTPPN